MKKRIRWTEFLIEKGIAGISFLSLASIFLIFIFVFREAAPILDGNTVESNTDYETSSEGVGSSDSYGDDVGASESYGDDVGPSESYGDPVGPSETYGDEVGPSETYGEPEPSAEVGPSESYGEPPASEAVGPSETYGEPESETPLASSETFEPEEASTEAAPADQVEPPRASLVRNLLLDIWQPVGDHPKFGIPPLLLGSFKVALIAILIAAPIGILAALFTSTFAPGWMKETMKPIIEILAGIPSVVIGFFALTILASVVQHLLGLEYRLNAFVGGLAMSLAVIPLIYTLSEDSLASIPKHYSEGSLALGATLWETNIRVVLPAAIPGIFASVLLGLGRAFGETMIVLMATGNAGILSFDPFVPVRTVSASIGSEMAEVVFGDQHYTILFFLGVILFLFSFLLNAVAEIFIRQRLSAKFGGAS